MKRSAPEQGYDFGNKRNYRRQIWGWLSKEIRHKHDVQVLLMPSKEGNEIESAMGRGFRECNIHAVDRNPALLASARWRKLYPQVHVYGSELPRACERMRRQGIRLSAANLDLCGAISSNATRDALQGALRSGVFAERACVAVTMLSGRDAMPAMTATLVAYQQHCQDYVNDALQENPEDVRLPWFINDAQWQALSLNDQARLFHAYDSCLDAFCNADQQLDAGIMGCIKRFGRYRSTAGTQYMLWIGMDLRFVDFTLAEEAWRRHLLFRSSLPGGSLWGFRVGGEDE